MAFLSMRGHRQGRMRGWSIVAATSAALLGSTLLTQAQTAAVPARSIEVISYDIPAQPLTSALTAFAIHSGLKLAYSAPLTQGRTAPALRGSFTQSEALGRLLAGSGLSYRFTSANAVSIYNPATTAADPSGGAAGEMLDTIAVQGERADGPVDGYVATRSETGSKVDVPLIATPQSISVVTRDQFQDQAATTVSEALRYTAGIVTGQAGLQSRRFDPIFMRGFGGYSADASYVSYIDGLRWNFPARTAVQFDPFLLERVEVFKGPSSVLYGQATPGGFVNLVSKRPSDVAQGEVFIRGGNNKYIEGGFDLSGPVDAEGKLLYRMIGLGRSADTQVDFQQDQRILLAPSFTWRPNTDTSLTVQFVYQHDPETSEASFVPVLGSVLPTPNGKLKNTLFTGEPAWSKFERTQAWASYQFEHRFNEVVTVRQNVLYGQLKDDFRGVDLSATTAANFLHADQRTADRLAVWAKHNDDQTFSIDNQIEFKYNIGPVANTTLVGLDYQYMDAPWTYGWGSAPSLDLFNPVYGTAAINPVMRVNFQESLNQTGLYAQNIAELGNWRLWLGGREDWARTQQERSLISTGTVLSDAKTSSDAFTGRAGLVYLFDSGLAPYFSYSESFQPQAGTTIDGSAFKPTTGQQYEVGLKYQPQGYNAFFTVSLFDITKQNVSTVDPTNPLYATQTGEITSRGVEFEAKASLGNGFNLTLAYAYTDAEVSKSNTTYDIYGDIGGGETGVVGTASQLGKTPVGVARNTASAWLDYKVPEASPFGGFSIGGGVRYIGSTYGTDSNIWGTDPNVGLVAPQYSYTAAKVPSYTLFDMVVGYDFGVKNPKLKGLSLDVNAKNLFDKSYVASCNPYYTCYYGEGRTVLATLRYKW
ncbi:TonB-dependent siderophore receptor [Ancylobacter sp. 6x-1]|uniref:TonB-dependent siderophore receptor n=1 Tax=Ancylobacter crimeensis TaxID=2579147 RepID=A0ABT0DAH2_9HYPH|nr:TonB-dependent siderophore receptor [Ancylobacter crimeensis]MCK0196963.1 TonB-dependent siderophore receptor [Ancylobacter crimeensis]